VVANTTKGSYKGFIIDKEKNVLAKAGSKKKIAEDLVRLGKESRVKFIVLVPDGMADEPLVELGGKTPLAAANTPHMDFLASADYPPWSKPFLRGCCQVLISVNLALMGYNPKVNFSGRAPLEAASLGIKIKDDEVLFAAI